MSPKAHLSSSTTIVSFIEVISPYLKSPSCSTADTFKYVIKSQVQLTGTKRYMLVTAYNFLVKDQRKKKAVTSEKCFHMLCIPKWFVLFAGLLQTSGDLLLDLRSSENKCSTTQVDFVGQINWVYCFILYSLCSF